MSNDPAVDDLMDKVSPERGKRVAILVSSLIAVAVLIGFVVNAFSNKDVYRSSAAMVEATPQQVSDASPATEAPTPPAP